MSTGNPGGKGVTRHFVRRRMPKVEVEALLDQLRERCAVPAGASLRELSALIDNYDFANAVKRAGELAMRLVRAGRLTVARASASRADTRYFASRTHAAAWLAAYEPPVKPSPSSLAALRQAKRRAGLDPNAPVVPPRTPLLVDAIDGEFKRLGPGRYAEPASGWVAAAMAGRNA